MFLTGQLHGSRFCVGQSTSDPQGSTDPASRRRAHSFQSTYNPQISIGFNKSSDLFWDRWSAKLKYFIINPLHKTLHSSVSIRAERAAFFALDFEKCARSSVERSPQIGLWRILQFAFQCRWPAVNSSLRLCWCLGTSPEFYAGGSTNSSLNPHLEVLQECIGDFPESKSFLDNMPVFEDEF